METRSAGPLSAAAQAVMAVLRAQYADRIHKTRYRDSLSAEARQSQDQHSYNKPSELCTLTDIPWHRPYPSSSVQMERAERYPQSTPTDRPSAYTKPHWRVLYEDEERPYFDHSPGLQLPCQPAVPLFQSEVSRFSQWGTDKAGNWEVRDCGVDRNLFALNGQSKITVLGNNVPEMHPQGEEAFANWGNLQAMPDVVMLPEEQREICSRKEKGCLMDPTEDASEAERVAYTPPRKRWSFGHLQIPTINCSKDKEENSRQTSDFDVRSNQVEMSENIQVNVLWSGFPDKDVVCVKGQKENNVQPLLYNSHSTDVTERCKRESLKNSLDSFSRGHDRNEKLCLSNENNLQEPIQTEVVVPSVPPASAEATGIDQDTLLREGGSMNTGTEKEETALEENTCDKSVVLVCEHIYDDVGLSDERNVQVKAAVSPESRHSATPVGTKMHLRHQELLQVVSRGSGVKSVTKSVLKPKKPEKWKPPQSLRGFPKITPSQEACAKHPASRSKFSNPLQKSSHFPGTEVPVFRQSQQGKGTQFLNLPKSAPSLNERPVETSNLQNEQRKQETKVESQSDISKPSKQKCCASEITNKIHLEGGKVEDSPSASAKLTLALTCDPRVCDATHLSQIERECVLEEAGRARALVVTMIYQDGTTQLDPDKKPAPAVCGLLILLKKNLDLLDLEQPMAAEERVLFLRLEQRPVWVQQDPQHDQDLFTREILLKMVCGTQNVVCFKAKDLLRTALGHFRDLSWKQVARSQALDPQIAAWLLDPADSACCFQDLLNKHCTLSASHTSAHPAVGHSKVTQAISSLCHLHRLMVELRNKLQTQGLWQLYFCMEQKMIPLLAAMESHRIHVDKEALKKTSEMLGTKMKQLEQEAHQAAGQQFLVSSSVQLRLVLFEKLSLHKLCENKKLPKTMLKQQQSTSEAALLQLQDLHPLPKIILEYRQVHKMKSTFVDGILSCVTKSFISSTWNQTSTVSGRLSAKHPNFQALPKQPVQITKKYMQGKEEELVTVHPRTMFIPQDGWTFLSADFCQVELRLLAHLSSDPELMKIFQNPEVDVFAMLASQWKGVCESSVTSEDREHAKRIVYSVVYGAGKERLSSILGVSAEEASRFQDSFLQTYREVQAFIQRTVQHCHKYGYVKSIMGRRRSLPHVHSTDWGIRNQAERQAVNFVVQGSAADLCKMAMIQICSHVSSSTVFTARLVAQIHDELLFEVEDSQVEDFAVLVKKTMESLQHIDCLGVSLTVPLKVSVSKGRSWGSMCELILPHAATHTSL